MAPSRGLLFALAVLWGLHSAGCALSTQEIEVVVPPYEIQGEVYLCVPVKLPEKPLRLVGIWPLSEEQLVHHMLLYGCASSSTQPVWECQGHGVCSSQSQQILYGWGKNAPPMQLPPGVGFQVGQGTSTHTLVLQVHFSGPRPKGDTSGVRLSVTTEHTPFMAGMLMYASLFDLPPQQPSTLVRNRCCLGGFEPAHGFAFRVHTHQHGRSVYQDRMLPSGEMQRVVEHSPQLPQGFTPVSNVTFWPGDHLEATCDFETKGTNHVVSAGGSHHNEMCNLYFMMWSELPVFLTCFNNGPSFERHGPGGIPSPAELVPEAAGLWQPPPLGQVSGVTQGAEGSLWVLHRGSRTWDGSSWSRSDPRLTSYDQGIVEEVVLRIDQDTGKQVAAWGAGQLYMPHSVTADREGNVWVTDVGLHVARKYSPAGQLLLELGKPGSPGSGPDHFCKPTDVAVSSSAGVFVSDGYCNARVAQFTANGSHVGDFVGSLAVPHAVALDECRGHLYVASREAKQVAIFELGSRKELGHWDLTKHGYVYDLAVGPYDVIFALCWDRDAPGSPSSLVQLSYESGPVVGSVWPLPGVEGPHAITVTAGPIRLAEKRRPLAVLVAETRPAGSRLHKFLLLPEGEALSREASGQSFLSAAQSYAAMALGQSQQQPEAEAADDRPAETGVQLEQQGLGMGLSHLEAQQHHHVHHRRLLEVGRQAADPADQPEDAGVESAAQLEAEGLGTGLSHLQEQQHHHVSHRSLREASQQTGQAAADQPEDAGVESAAQLEAEGLGKGVSHLQEQQHHHVSHRSLQEAGREGPQLRSSGQTAAQLKAEGLGAGLSHRQEQQRPHTAHRALQASWDADRTAAGLGGSLRSLASGLQSLTDWSGGSGEWLAWLVYGGAGADAEAEEFRASTLAPSVRHAGLVALPLCLLVAAVAGALWLLAGSEQ